MTPVEDDCLCIRHWDFSETSQTVGVFTRSLGVIRAIAKGSRREKSPFSGGVDLLTRAQGGLIVRRGHELSTLTSWNLSQTWSFLRSDMRANRAAFLFADVTGRMLMPHEPHPRAFDALIQALDTLERGDGVDATVTRFLWSILEVAGETPRLPNNPFAPSTTPRESEVFLPFFPHDGGFVQSGSGVSWPVRMSTVVALEQLITGVAPPADTEASTRSARLLVALVREILGSEPPTVALLYPEISGSLPFATITPWQSNTNTRRLRTGSASTPKSTLTPRAQQSDSSLEQEQGTNHKTSLE
ncbi:MAG: DNA repair protein RecO [Planctomycetota bacterium]|nr:DNA repair protein RecO [Planctomycetota bacterium]